MFIDNFQKEKNIPAFKEKSLSQKIADVEKFHFCVEKEQEKREKRKREKEKEKEKKKEREREREGDELCGEDCGWSEYIF